ncbi:MAG TPA: hypothetical protein DEH78_06850 [Solibacterales bacterium]|nr:hypothetical protein [Bryobacterales bacterium]
MTKAVPALALSLLISGVLAASFLTNYENWGDDWAGYLLQAKSVLEGRPRAYLAENTFMVKNSSILVGPHAYPWGLPVILALESRVAGFELGVFKRFNVAFLLLLMAATWALAARFVSAASALSIALMLGLNPGMLNYCNRILSEFPFMLATVSTFLLMEATLHRPRGRTAAALALGAGAFLCFAIRTNGVAMLAAVSARQLLPLWQAGFRRASRADWLRLVLPYAAFAVLQLVFTRMYPAAEEGHFEVLRGLTMGTIWENLRTYPIAIFEFFTAGRGGSAVFALLLGPLVCWGAVKSFARTGHITLYFAATFAIYVLWPAGQGYRFMMPLVPFLLILLLSGVEHCAAAGRWARFAGPGGTALRFGLPAVFLTASVWLLAAGRLPREAWHPQEPASTELFAWIRANTRREDLIGFFKPRVMHLLGERVSLTTGVPDAGKLAYLVSAGPRPWNELEPGRAEYERVVRLEPVFANEVFRVYRVSKR